MVGLDTNVLVRYLVEDDRPQAQVAARLLESGETFFINLIVLCELTWVLESCYDLGQTQVVGAIEKILSTRQLLVENSSLVWGTLEDCKKTGVDFSGCLIGRLNKHHECQTTFSFDKSLKKLAAFTFLS